MNASTAYLIIFALHQQRGPADTSALTLRHEKYKMSTLCYE
jgi:hypothetical protein